MMRSRVFVLITSWFLAFVLGGIIIGLVIDAPNLLMLRRESAETTGRVARLVPNSHGLVEVLYEIAGKAYTGEFQPHIYDQPLNEGDVVRVYYSPQNPTIAFLAPPSDVLKEQFPAWIAGSLVLSIFGVVAALTLWRPRSPSRRFGVFLPGPRFISAGITLGVLTGLTVSLFTHTLNITKISGWVLIVSGCTMFLVLAWVKELHWVELLHSRTFWLALTLAIIGNLVNLIR